MFGRNERDLEKELKFHIEEQVRQFMREGLDEVEARRRARLMFGGTEQIKELCRDERRSRWMEDFFRDCVYGVRTLRRSPAFTCAAVLSLALGMGANVAIFGLIDHVILRMMPVRDPEYLVEFRKYQPPYGRGDISYPLFEALRKETRSFEGMFAHADLGRRDIDLSGTPEQVDVEAVSGSYHSVLGVDAAAGRVLSDDDDRLQGDHPVAVISYGFWKRRLGGDPSAVGKTFRLNKTAFTIIGVTPPEFFGTFAGKAPDITFPLAMNGEVRGDESWLRYPGRSWLSVMARLRKDQPLEQARAEVRTLYLRRQAEAAKFGDERRKKEILAQSLNLEPGGNGFDDLRYRFSEPLKVLMGLVALVLAIACANVANLLLAKSAARQREIGVRLAIGAGRGRVIRQLLTEGLLLSALGGAAGIVLGYWSANALVTMMSNGGPRMALEVRLDVRVITFAVMVTIVSCLAFSLAPAIQGTRDSLQRALRQVGITSRWRLGKALVVAQLAISIVLLVGAGLFGRTLLNFYQMDAGFEREGVWMFSLKDSHDLRQRVLAELRAIPGVASAGVALVRPVSGGG